VVASLAQIQVQLGEIGARTQEELAIKIVAGIVLLVVADGIVLPVVVAGVALPVVEAGTAEVDTGLFGCE
jgi:hypothetical protein